MKHLLGNTRNGKPVYVDLIYSQAAAHIAQHPYLATLIQEALRKIKASGSELRIEHDTGRTIGYDFVVKTTDNDNVLYACLVKDDTYTRFVKNGKPTPTSHLTLVLRLDQEGDYELADAWIGRANPPRPGSIDETAESRGYWSEHAFVLDNQSLRSQTVTKACPY